MGDPAGAAVEVVLKPIVDGIYSRLKRQCNYLCCFHSNVQTLRGEARSLEAARATLQRKVDDARRNGLEIRDEVKNWLEDTNMNQAKMIKIEDGILNVQSCWSNIILRYSVTKKANKTAETMAKLRDENNFGDDIALPPPPAAMVPFPLQSIITLQCREQIEEMIVEAFGRPNVNIVGVGGTGGIGKTSLAEKLINRMMSEKLVDETIKAVVSQSVNVLGIQESIAAQVGLKLDSETDKVARAHKLRTVLNSTGKKIIVLDDVWEQLNFAEIGIPSGSDSSGCKILLTSRNTQLLRQMGAQVFAMGILTKEDAWSLFQYKAGTCVEDPDLKPIAEEVLSECKGLPIAIVTVGSALKDQRIEVWKDATVQLKNAKPTDIDGVEEHVYNSLRLSYDYLKSEGAKSLFLLCCIFPEDFEISLESLALYGTGLNMFDRIDLAQARNRVFALVEKLKSCSLLLDGNDEKHVKMHDVVRDVARFIARERKLIDEQPVSKGQHASNCEGDFIQDFPEGSNYKIGTNLQCLHLLIILPKIWRTINVDGFPCVGGMPDLKVLSLEQISFKSPPQWKGLLENLKTLELNHCPLKSLSFVGELRGLEILKCKWCDEIEELPIEIGNLSRLKLLDLNSCHKLKRIRAGVISKLIELEELKILKSFKEWEATQIVNEAEMEQNASLKELESLQKLTWLEIEIANIELVKENMRFPENIIKYDIQIGSYRFTHKDKDVSSYPCLLTKHSHCFGSWIHKFVSAAEVIDFNGDWSNKFIPSDCFGIMVKTLRVVNGEELVSLVNTSRMSTDLRKHGVFPVLEHMELSNLPDLTHICDGPILKGLTSFRDLRELNLSNLPSLKQVLRGSKIEDAVSKLKKLVISDCEKMEEVFLMEKNEQVGKKSKLTFPNMIEMEIRNTPNLKTFVKGIESIEFPSLMDLSLINSPKLKWMDSDDGHSNDEYSVHYFCNKKVTFGMLKILTIQEYNIARSLWCGQISPQFVIQNVSFNNLSEICIRKCNELRNLFLLKTIEDVVWKLKKLVISECEKMEEVFFIERTEQVQKNSELAFPNMVRMEIRNMPNLTAFGKGIESIEFPSLVELCVEDCPKLKWMDSEDGCTDDEYSLHYFCDKKVIFGMLKKLNIFGYDTARNLWCKKVVPPIFDILEELRVNRCHKIRIFCSFPIAKNLIHLKRLRIGNCDQMEHLIGVEKQTHQSFTTSSEILEGFLRNGENEDGGRAPFPKLEELEFRSLTNFKTLCEGTESFQLPMLHFLSIMNCGSLKVIKSNQNQVDKCNCDNDSIHFFCNEQLPFSGLKQLYIYDYDDVSNLWCQQIPPCFFHTLEELDIYGCPKLKSAFPYSVATHLRNLKLLRIFDCFEMELVVSGVEKETHEQNSILLFPSLVHLEIIGVPSLEMFCERGCCLTLPSLEFMSFEGDLVRKSIHRDEGMEDWNNLLCQHILMSKKKWQQQEQQEQQVKQQEAEISGVEEFPSLSGQEFGSYNAPDMVPKPVPDQAESSTTAAQHAATMDNMTAEITYPDHLIEQQSAQHDG